MSSRQITLRQIARRAGVSASTVSRVLSGQARAHRISASAESRIRACAARLNFVPNQLARSLRLRRTQTLGLVIPDISNPFFSAVARQVALGARAQGYSIVLCDSQENPDQEREAVELLFSRHVDGLILCPVGQSAAHLKILASRGVPMVQVDRVFPGLGIPCVVSDNVQGARDATQCLVDHGHRRIACIQGLRGSYPNELRVRGYREALQKNGIRFDAKLVAGANFSRENGYAQTRELLRRNPGFTAILALSNPIAFGVLQALEEHGLGIPADLSVIAFDEQPYSAYLATPMTTVAQPCGELGQAALKLLTGRIEAPDRKSPPLTMLSTEIHLRKSVRRVAPIPVA
ncbi:MAG: LacI family DNA-binding transcriptional regulator [Verrucomicrobiota bacterium]